MSTSTNSDPFYLENNCPWYESPDGTCRIHEPTLIHMGEDNALHLFFPVHWSDSLSVLPQAQNQARELNAILVLMLYGEVSLDQMTSLVIELASHCVVPFWIGEENRSKFNRAIEMARSQKLSQN